MRELKEKRSLLPYIPYAILYYTVATSSKKKCKTLPFSLSLAHKVPQTAVDIIVQP